MGWPIGLGAFLANEFFGQIDIQFLYLTGIMLAFSLAVLVAVTLATPAPTPAEVRQVTWTRQLWQDETADLRRQPWWRNCRPYAITLIVITGLALIPFW